MTVKELKEILNSLSDDTLLLIDTHDMYDDVGTVLVEHHSDRRTYVIFSSNE